MTGSPTVKKGRHRRYEEARNLKRGPDLDIEAIFNDLASEPGVVAAVVEDPAEVDIEDDIEVDPDLRHDEIVEGDDERR